MCNPMCATAQRMAELEVENARLRGALEEAQSELNAICGDSEIAMKRIEVLLRGLDRAAQMEARDAG